MQNLSSSRLTERMKETVAYSVEHVDKGGIPFTAFVLDRHGTVLGRGVNRVRLHCDPTAHAEVEAIRDACRTHGIQCTSGATLLASSEPCAMCYMSSLFSGISKVYFAASRDEAASYGFDYRSSYDLYAADPTTWGKLRPEALRVDDGLVPFQKFAQRSVR